MDNINESTNPGQNTIVAATTKANILKRISWSSVFAGVLIAVVIQLALSLLGIGIGLSTVDLMQENNPANGLGIGTAIWYAVSSLIALYAGGWVAGRLAQTPKIFDGVMHGLLSWSLITLLTFYLLTTTIGSIIGGVGSLVGNVVGTVGNVAAKSVEAAAPAIGNKIEQQIDQSGIHMNDIKGEARLILQQTGKTELQPENLERQAKSTGANAQTNLSEAATNPQNAGSSIDAAFDQLFSKGKSTIEAVDKDAAANVIVARTGKSKQEADQIVTNWVSAYQQAEEKVQQLTSEAAHAAKQAADATADAVSTACIIAFFSMILGAVVAGFGARNGTHSKDHASTITTT